MATITARNVDDRDYRLFGEIARENGRSISDELRALIAEHARTLRARKLVVDLEELSRAHPLRLAPGEDAVSLVRAIRDEE